MSIFRRQESSQSPYRLAIGVAKLKNRRLKPKVNAITDLRSGATASLEQMAATIDATSFVFVGENHDNPKHHQFQASVIRALVQRGRSVIVGMEMFDRTKQYPLDLWTLGKLNETQFVEQSDWKNQWGFDYHLYKPIFDAVKENKLRLVALNIPRPTVSKVGRSGWDSLSEEEKMGVPNLDLSQSEHRKLFEALMQGHPPGAALDRVYAAQVLWDTGMADSVIRYWESTPHSDRTVFVVLAGNGHVMYRCGINLRLAQRTPLAQATIVCLEASKGGAGRLEVTRSLADYVYVSD